MKFLILLFIPVALALPIEKENTRVESPVLLLHEEEIRPSPRAKTPTFIINFLSPIIHTFLGNPNRNSSRPIDNNESTQHLLEITSPPIQIPDQQILPEKPQVGPIPAITSLDPKVYDDGNPMGSILSDGEPFSNARALDQTPLNKQFSSIFEQLYGHQNIIRHARGGIISKRSTDKILTKTPFHTNAPAVRNTEMILTKTPFHTNAPAVKISDSIDEDIYPANTQPLDEVILGRIAAHNYNSYSGLERLSPVFYIFPYKPDFKSVPVLIDYKIKGDIEEKGVENKFEGIITPIKPIY